MVRRRSYRRSYRPARRSFRSSGSSYRRRSSGRSGGFLGGGAGIVSVAAGLGAAYYMSGRDPFFAYQDQVVAAVALLPALGMRIPGKYGGMLSKFAAGYVIGRIAITDMKSSKGGLRAAAQFAKVSE